MMSKEEIMKAKNDVVELWLHGKIDDDNFRVFMDLVREVSKVREVQIQ
jgi:hypothetical protein